MSFLSLTILLCFASVARAHFRLLFPEPRGVFVADQEPNYCGGYTNAVPNRTVYPLSGGFFSIKSGHPGWTVGVIISTVQNPTSFENFSSNGVQQFVSPYAKEASAGTFCMPLNVSASNATGVKDGANVTIQIVFSGGDGNLYQNKDVEIFQSSSTLRMYCQPKFFTLALLALVAGVNAHFQLQFPSPRGAFVEDNEPTFCDGYANPAANRTEFPLTGGFITLNSEHPLWTSGILLSTASDPTSFNNFSQITPYAQAHGEGLFCLPFDLSATNATGLQDGQNVTIQFVFNGGDGNLYQCADLTLSKNFTISSSITCSNASVSATATSTGAAATGSKSAALGTVPAFGVAGIVTALFGISLATVM